MTLNPSLVPTDVTFVISQCGSEVKAHKWVLAMGSPVLQKLFYGALAKGTEETVLVKETTKEAFVKKLDFLYGKEVDWKVMTVDELFNIANMAEKYHVDALKESVKKALEAYPIDENNVVICASHAREYHQFEELSQALLLHCTKFLKSVVVKAEDYEMFAAKYCDSDFGETAIKLLGMMSKVAPVPAAQRSEENKAKFKVSSGPSSSAKRSWEHKANSAKIVDWEVVDDSDSDDWLMSIKSLKKRRGHKAKTAKYVYNWAVEDSGSDF